MAAIQPKRQSNTAQTAAKEREKCQPYHAVRPMLAEMVAMTERQNHTST
jgi:hypothetical protein